jgi:ligand-binding sensor domain-containing protein
MGVSSTKMVHSILRDSKGTMWFGTNAGLFSYANNRLKNISDEVDIPTNFVNKLVEDKKVDSGFRLQKDFFISKEIALPILQKCILRKVKEQAVSLWILKVIFGLIALVAYTD